jgi:hypothetical protein
LGFQKIRHLETVSLENILYSTETKKVIQGRAPKAAVFSPPPEIAAK